MYRGADLDKHGFSVTEKMDASGTHTSEPQKLGPNPQKPLPPLQQAPLEQGMSGVQEPTGSLVVFWAVWAKTRALGMMEDVKRKARSGKSNMSARQKEWKERRTY